MNQTPDQRSVIVLELNELTPRLMDQFIARGDLPNFAKLKRESVVCLTDAEEPPETLEPWIQWVTVHTGKSYAEHGVFEHTDGPNYKGDRIWDMLSDAGRRVWLCGSMALVVRNSSINGFVLPDYWAEEIVPLPAGEFDDFHRFVSTYVKEHVSDSVSLTPKDYVKFLWFMLTHGLSFETIASVARQLLTERQLNRKWARALILDQLQMDVFSHYWRKLRPKFSTMFSNSTAHFQHFHWRSMEPEAFDVPPSNEDRMVYEDAIRSGYINMDWLVGRALKLAGPETTVVFVTALSQQPMLTWEESGGKLLNKANDPAWLAAYAGVDAPFKILPAMSGQYYLEFSDEATALAAAKKLSCLTLDDGEMLLHARPTNEKVSIVCGIFRSIPGETRIHSPVSHETPRFDDTFHLVGLRSGRHHPEGMLWVRTPTRRHEVVARKISLREIAPTMMHLCGVQPPEGAFDFPPIPELEAA